MEAPAYWSSSQDTCNDPYGKSNRLHRSGTGSVPRVAFQLLIVLSDISTTELIVRAICACSQTSAEGSTRHLLCCQLRLLPLDGRWERDGDQTPQFGEMQLPGGNVTCGFLQ